MSKTREGINTGKGFIVGYEPIQVSVDVYFYNSTDNDVDFTLSYYNGGEKQTVRQLVSARSNYSVGMIADLGSLVCASNDGAQFNYNIKDMPCIEQTDSANDEQYSHKATFLIVGRGSGFMELTAVE